MKTEMYKKTVTVGRLDEGKINITVEIANKRGPIETIDHRRAPWAHVLSMTGEIFTKNGRGTVSCGQIDMSLKDADLSQLKPTKGAMMTQEHLEILLKICERWHLNDLRAGCIHQADHLPNGPNAGDWQKRADLETAKCPKGYKYGSKWLCEPLPKNVYKLLTDIMNQYEEV